MEINAQTIGVFLAKYGAFLIILSIALLCVFPLHMETELRADPPIPAGSKITYPLVSSVCCEAVGGTVRASIAQIRTTERSWKCPSFTSDCFIRKPQITCPNPDWNAPFGFLAVWKLKFNFAGTGLVREYYSLAIPGATETLPEGDNGFTINSGDYMYYQGACIPYQSLASPPAILAVIKKGYNASAEWDIRYTKTMLVSHPALEGSFILPGTINCRVNGSAIQDVKNTAPLPLTIWNAFTSVASMLTGKPKQTNVPTASSDLFYKVNTNLAHTACYWAVDKWIDLPAYGNVNPLGQYKGTNVLCSDALTGDKGIFAVVTVSTYGGTKYYAPLARLTTPPNFCCSKQTCEMSAAGGKDVSCVNYSCIAKPAQTQCTSDLQCQISTSGQCVSSGDAHYKLTSACVSGKCVDTKTPQKCCDAECNAIGMSCSPSYGCKPVCQDHSYTGCSADGNIYYFTSCGTQQEKYKTCSYGCEGSTCKPKPEERPVCGNTVCETGERSTCPKDCPVCGDNYCSTGEKNTCPEDCGKEEEEKLCDIKCGTLDVGCYLSLANCWVQHWINQVITILIILLILFFTVLAILLTLPKLRQKTGGS